jgi:nucleoside-diphosphate-sugar epimerase
VKEENMRILLTGGSGFLGMNLARFLKNKNVDVLCIGRHTCPIPGVNNIHVSSLTFENIDRILIEDKLKIDAILHLAAAGVHPAERDHNTLLEINTVLPAKIVTLGQKHNVKAIVITGSSAEYQEPSEPKRSVETDPLQAHKLYGATKAAGGLCALSQGIALQVPVGWIRLFNIYGPGEPSHRLFPSILSQLRAKKPVEISAGTQVRDFVYVEDACEGLWSALNALLSGQMSTGAYNLCTGEGHRVKDFALAIAHQLKMDTDLLRFGSLPLRPDDILHLVGEPSAFKSASGWVASYSFEQGIEHAIGVTKCH